MSGAPDASGARSVTASPDPQAGAAPEPAVSQISGVIGPGTFYQGLVAFRGELRIDGDLEGEVVAEGTLWIGEQARVRGRIEADQLIVAGRLAGEAVVRDRIELLPSARVEAALSAPLLHVAEGSVMRGPCRAGRSPEAEEDPARPTLSP